MAAIDAVTYPQGGSTNMAAAFSALCNDVFTPIRGDRPEAQNIALLVTDGQSTSDPANTMMEVGWMMI